MNGFAFVFVILGVILVSALLVLARSEKKSSTSVSRPAIQPTPEFSDDAAASSDQTEEEEVECRCSAPGDACCAK